MYNGFINIKFKRIQPQRKNHCGADLFYKGLCIALFVCEHQSAVLNEELRLDAIAVAERTGQIECERVSLNGVCTGKLDIARGKGSLAGG